MHALVCCHHGGGEAALKAGLWQTFIANRSVFLLNISGNVWQLMMAVLWQGVTTVPKQLLPEGMDEARYQTLKTLSAKMHRGCAAKIMAVN